MTDVPASEVDGRWYRYRGWIEQGFRQWKRGGWGWHRTRVVASERVFLDWLVYALGQLAVVVLGVEAEGRFGFWNRRCRSVSVYRVGLLVVLAWLLGWLAWDVGEFWGAGGGGELK